MIFAPGARHDLPRFRIRWSERHPITRLDEARRERTTRVPGVPARRPPLHLFRAGARTRSTRASASARSTRRRRRSCSRGGRAASYAWPGYLLCSEVARSWPSRSTRSSWPSRATRSSWPRPSTSRGFSALRRARSRSPRAPRDHAAHWFDRSGRPLGTVGEPGPYTQIALSPDERQAAVQRLDPRLQTSDIWLLDLAQGVLSRFTSDPGNEADPVWSPDGRRLAFTARGEGGQLTIFQKPLSGAPAERVLPDRAGPSSRIGRRDGRFLLYASGVGGRDGLWAVPLFGDRKPFPLVQGPVPNDEPQLSPDGRFLAYMSYESGRFEVYVQAFRLRARGLASRRRAGGSPMAGRRP